jgi:hypothetical protein
MLKLSREGEGSSSEPLPLPDLENEERALPAKPEKSQGIVIRRRKVRRMGGIPVRAREDLI